MTPERQRDVLRWYPRVWRERYGEELLALVEDYSDESRLRRRDRVDLIRVGLLMRRRKRTRSSTRIVPKVAVRLASCAAAVAAFGAITVGAASAQSAHPTTRQVVVATERSAAVVGIGGVAAVATIRRNK